jgi:hypothetical protein
VNEQRTDAEWRAADRRKRINDLAARYAGQIFAEHKAQLLRSAHSDLLSRQTPWHEYIDHAIGEAIRDARTLAAAVVDAEEQ